MLNDTQHGVRLQTRWGQPGHVHDVLAQRWRLNASVGDMLSIETGPNSAPVSRLTACKDAETTTIRDLSCASCVIVNVNKASAGELYAVRRVHTFGRFRSVAVSELVAGL